MTDSASKKVRDLWWEGKDLHVVDEDDVHSVFEGAWIQSVDYRYEYGPAGTGTTEFLTRAQPDGQALKVTRIQFDGPTLLESLRSAMVKQVQEEGSDD